MAIYHLEAKMVSRGAGRSAVAASAYLSCSRMLNEYDGVQHDYTRKQGLAWQTVFLPDMAPAEWQDREKLWNAVEEAEKTKDSRLAREFVAALPIELSRQQQIELLQNFICEQFVAEGMCADVAIHDTDGHNPHAHILLTVRPLNENGTWQYKTEKEYLCVKDGNERGFTAAEFKSAQAEGWEKQYPYKVGKKKVYMAPSAAQAHGYVRSGKHPKSTRYGRQNPISARWNSEEQLLAWREVWATAANRCLELAGHAERIDHRSHAARGLEERPTIHEGVAAQALERRGIISDRCELNQQIKADNALLRELKAEIKKLADLVALTVPVVAEKLEKLRSKVLILCYQLSHIRVGQKQYQETLNVYRSQMARYTGLVQQIKDKSKERKALLTEKKTLPARKIFKHKELASKIAELTEDLEELRSEKALLLKHLDYAEDAEAETFRKDISALEASLQKLEAQEQKYSVELETVLQEYAGVKAQSTGLDPVELYEARHAIRSGYEAAVNEKLEQAYGDKYSPLRWMEAKRAQAKLTNDSMEEYAARKLAKQKYKSMSQPIRGWKQEQER
ncbi:MobQ family relaxase [Flavonifractor plautii]|uniref:MobQ family relaxase n=1 Tax=Flavonifractor plautii TaxID=292800 RepID=UPI0018AC0882|nr:MobQ family relaxase [Flavonifractor plautii]MDB7958237.1 MobA/MobL family protein [Flavonifractor plautii]